MGQGSGLKFTWPMGGRSEIGNKRNAIPAKTIKAKKDMVTAMGRFSKNLTMAYGFTILTGA